MNRSKLFGASIVTMLMVLSGCADNTGGAADSSSPPATDAVISLVRTGGIAGIHDQLMVDKDGSWTTTDRVGDRRTGRLTDDQRAALRNLAADRRLAYESTRVQGPTNNFGVDRQTVQWYAEQPAPDMTLKLVGAVGRKP